MAMAHALTVEDPTGNSGNYASPHEPVWRLRTFVRRELEDLKSSELLVLTNLVIPHLARGQELAEVGLVSPFAGGKIEVLGFIQPYDRTENETPPFGTEPLAASAAVVLNPEPGDGKATGKARLVIDIAGLTATDAVIWRSHQGRIDDVEIIEGGGGVIRLDPGERRYVVDLSGLTNDLIDRIEIGISRALSFEFLVNPRDVEGCWMTVASRCPWAGTELDPSPGTTEREAAALSSGILPAALAFFHLHDMEPVNRRTSRPEPVPSGRNPFGQSHPSNPRSGPPGTTLSLL